MLTTYTYVPAFSVYAFSFSSLTTYLCVQSVMYNRHDTKKLISFFIINSVLSFQFSIHSFVDRLLGAFA
jgi:hypothetical protein